jgi:hypothetical protein
VVKAVASHCDKEVMKLLLKHQGDYVEITEEVLKAAAWNSWNGKEAMKVLPEERGDQVKITEEVLKEAAGNVGNGKEVMKLLLGQRGDQVKITEDVRRNYTNPKTSLYLDNTLADAPRSQNCQERILVGTDEENPLIQMQPLGLLRTVPQTWPRPLTHPLQHQAHHNPQEVDGGYAPHQHPDIKAGGIFTGRVPPYAILSRTRGFGEVSHRDFQGLVKCHRMKGVAKIRSACAQARKDGLEYLWVDTCRIDKSSSSELQGSINSV